LFAILVITENVLIPVIYGLGQQKKILKIWLKKVDGKEAENELEPQFHP
jgi:hypothetical protein